LKMTIYANGLWQIAKRDEETLTLQSMRDKSLEVACNRDSALLEKTNDESLNYYLTKYANANGNTKQAYALK
jgi:hypothetical protein